MFFSLFGHPGLDLQRLLKPKMGRLGLLDFARKLQGAFVATAG